MKLDLTEAKWPRRQGKLPSLSQLVFHANPILTWLLVFSSKCQRKRKWQERRDFLLRSGKRKERLYTDLARGGHCFSQGAQWERTKCLVGWGEDLSGRGQKLSLAGSPLSISAWWVKPQCTQTGLLVPLLPLLSLWFPWLFVIVFFLVGGRCQERDYSNIRHSFFFQGTLLVRVY